MIEYREYEHGGHKLEDVRDYLLGHCTVIKKLHSNSDGITFTLYA